MSLAVTLNGVPLVGSKVIRWGHRKGVEPVVGTFDITPDQQRQLEKNEAGLAPLAATLKIGNQEWKKLSIIDFVPGANPYLSAVVVADRRWLWPFKWILRRFNIRRNASFRRRELWDKGPLQIEPVREIIFARYSLMDEKTEWTPEDALAEILTLEDTLEVPLEDILLDGALIETFVEQRIDNVTVDDPGHVALQQVLNTMPGANVDIDADGNVVLFNEASGGELAEIAKGGPGKMQGEIVQGGHIDLNTNELTRPRQVDVYFTIEAEVRFDYIEQNLISPTVVEGPQVAKRDMTNVLPLPDYFLDFDVVDPSGSLRKARITQGTWVELNDYLRALIKNGEERGLLKDMTINDWHTAIRKAFVPETNLWSSLFLAGTFSADAGDQANWAVRLSALQSNYRTTYRLNPRYMDRTLSIRPYTVGTIDVATGQRSPAMVWSNYAVKNSFKFLIADAKANGGNYGSLAYARNIRAFDTFQKVGATSRPSPARVQILDPDQGVIRINYLLDPYKFDDLVFPSLLVNHEKMANPANAKLPGVPVSFGSVSRNGQVVPSLSPDHKIAVVLTLVPAAPNNKGQLYKISVSPGEVESRLPKAAQAGLKNAKGPIKEMRVSGGFETARIRWIDSRANDIEKMFGLQDGTPNFKDLVVNDVEDGAAQIPVGAGGTGVAASIREIARSIAASVYATEYDRVTGERTVALNRNIRVAGNLGEIVHEVTQQGVLTTTMRLPSGLQPISFRAFMDQGTRAILDRELQSAKGNGGG